MAHFSTLCDANPFNNEIIFFNGHDIHFSDLIFYYIDTQNIKLKSGDSDNRQPPKNGPIEKLKTLKNDTKAF